jgi:DNA polymerase I-like protein with 3'-5' exonuclease and polymerase domains
MIVVEQERLVLAGLLQSYEAIIMKTALRFWMEEARRQGVRFQLVNFVHDEWQTLVYGPKEEAERLGQIQADTFQKVADFYCMKCPLAGSFSVGSNWYETH